MTEPRYCIMPGCRKWGTCQSPGNCWLSADYKPPAFDREQSAKRHVAFTAVIGSARNARRLTRKAERKVARKKS
jgi:hypothetical protein